MKIASLRSGAPEGELILVNRSLRFAVSGAHIAPTVRAALESWPRVTEQLHRLADDLERGAASGVFPFDPRAVLAPVPRPGQWLDASAFPSHGRLMAKAFGLSPVSQNDWPLMYQGCSDYTLAAREDVPLPSEADAIDFEGEFAVVVDEVPMGIKPEEALRHVRLIVLVNDWSLRAFGPDEMRAGFGFIRAKPATAYSPVAVTPDELGQAWRSGRVELDLHVHRGEELFGRPNGREMAYDFGRLIAHAAYNRRLSAGAVIGSGTVSNADYTSVGSTCIAERRSIETIETGKPVTEFLRFGERVRVEAFDGAQRSVFGSIDQCIVAGGVHP
jgi:fumarylacetoacetate (FAA) hydrolase